MPRGILGALISSDCGRGCGRRRSRRCSRVSGTHLRDAQTHACTLHLYVGGCTCARLKICVRSCLPVRAFVGCAWRCPCLSLGYVGIDCGARYDWIVVDMEHSPNELNDVLTQLQAMQCTSLDVGRCDRDTWRPACNAPQLATYPSGARTGLIGALVQLIRQCRCSPAAHVGVPARQGRADGPRAMERCSRCQARARLGRADHPLPYDQHGALMLQRHRAACCNMSVKHVAT